jgi:UDP-N-acetylglucosamine:LPS N-acetylglucosamine transferase
MDTKTHKSMKFQPVLRSKKYKFLFIALNFYLLIGVLSLLVSIFYLLANLNQADKIIIYCIPGFIVFLSAFIFYLLGYQSMNSEQQNKNRHHKINKML